MIIRNKKVWELWIIFTVLIVIVCTISILSANTLIMNQYNESINKETKNNNLSITNNIATSIYSYIHSMIGITEQISRVLDKSPDKINDLHFILTDDIETILVSTGNETTLIENRDNQEVTIKPYKEQNWYRTIAPGSQIYSLTAPYVQDLFVGQSPLIVSLVTGMVWKDLDNKKMYSRVLVDLNLNSISKLCDSYAGNDGYIYVVSDEGDIIYHKDLLGLYEGSVELDVKDTHLLKDGNTTIEQNGEKYLVSVTSVRDTGWKVICTSKTKMMWSEENQMITFISIITCLILTIVAIFSIIISKVVTRPLTNLASAMNKLGAGKFEVRTHEKSFHEVNILSEAFNSMAIQLKLLMKEVVSAQEKLRKYEVNALYMQINPHFLYNILDSVIWLAEAKENEKVISITSSLGEFFRISLSGGKDLISVEQELKHAFHYLEIQKIRFEGQYVYNISCDDTLKKHMTLKTVLQPIIENAIVHGVGNLPYEGEIKIRVYSQNHNLIFEIKDNGYGISPKILNHILEREATSKSGIGIKNVDQRIKLIYGPEYGLIYESELDEGTSVKIIQPLSYEHH